MGQRPGDQDALEDLGQHAMHIRHAACQQAVDLAFQRALPVGDLGHRAGLAQFDRQVADLDLLAGRHHGQPVAEVFQLPHVALEIETRQILQGGLRQPLGFDTQFAGALLQEMAGEQRDVLAPLAQGGQADTDDVEAVEQVFAEQAVLDARFQVLVRRRDDPDVGLDRRMAANPVEMPIRQYAQQAGLQFGRHVTDFVEKQRAALSLLEAAAPLGLGTGKGAAFVAEEFRFEQILGYRRRVDGDEGLVGARAVPVQGTGDQLLARAGFASNQHRGVRQGETADGAKDFLHGRRLAENLRHQPLFFRRTALVH